MKEIHNNLKGKKTQTSTWKYIVAISNRKINSKTQQKPNKKIKNKKAQSTISLP